MWAPAMEIIREDPIPQESFIEGYNPPPQHKRQRTQVRFINYAQKKRCEKRRKISPGTKEKQYGALLRTFGASIGKQYDALPSSFVDPKWYAKLIRLPIDTPSISTHMIFTDKLNNSDTDSYSTASSDTFWQYYKAEPSQDATYIKKRPRKHRYKGHLNKLFNALLSLSAHPPSCHIPPR